MSRTSKHSQQLATSMVKYLDQSVWKKITEQQIVNKIVPYHVENINLHIFSSLVKLCSNPVQRKIKFNSVADRNSLKKDNLFKNYIQIQKPCKTIKSPTSPKQKIRNYSAKLKSPKKSLQQNPKYEQKQNSRCIRISQSRQHIQPTLNSQKQLSTHQQSIHDKIDTLRSKMFYLQQCKKNQQLQQKQLQLRNLQRRQQLQRKRKQMQKLAFDYDGQFINSKITHQLPTSSAIRLKSACGQQIKTSIQKQIKIHPISTILTNQKIQQRLKKKKSYRAQLHNNSNNNIQNINNLLNYNQKQQNHHKQKQLQLPTQQQQLKKQQKINLTQFKKKLIYNKFKHFKNKIYHDNTNLIEKNTINSYRSSQQLNLQKKLQQPISPPINASNPKSSSKTNKFRTLVNNIQDYSPVQKTIINSHVTTKDKGKGLIRVTNQPLYITVFNNFDQQL